MSSNAVALEGTTAAVKRALRGQRVDVRGRAFGGTLLLTLVVSLGVLLTLVWTTWHTASPVFAERGFGFVTSNMSSIASRAGVRQGVVGSLYLVAIVTFVSLPLGIGASVYLQEYARDSRLNRLLIANIRNLAGVPSIVYGILGFVVFAQALRAFTGPGSARPTLLAGGLTLAVLVMPIVVLVTMEALRAVPRSIREAAYGVGATRWEVVRSHVLPYAAPGIFTGAIISVARAFGETAPLLLVGAVQGYFTPSRGASVVDTLRGTYTALPTEIYSFSRQIGDEWKANAAAAIIVLLSVILLVNALAIVLRNRYERKW
jgi:phosphate transport system permease protein